jgi:hypothetical protein
VQRLRKRFQVPTMLNNDPSQKFIVFKSDAVVFREAANTCEEILIHKHVRVTKTVFVHSHLGRCAQWYISEEERIIACWLVIPGKQVVSRGDHVGVTH